jgi:hypothetical protein
MLAPSETMAPPVLAPGAAPGGDGPATGAMETEMEMEMEGNAVTDPGVEGDGDFTFSPPFVRSPDLGAKLQGISNTSKH